MLPILLLSPMQSIADIAPGVADELGISIHIENLGSSTVEAIVGNHPGVEVVVTRGGLAEQVRQIPGISVVEIAMSINELLSHLSNLTNRGFKRIGIVSQANLFGGVTGSFRILGAEMSIYPQRNDEEIEATVKRLAREGVEAIIGCRVAFRTARELNMEAIFLDSGPVSIKTALQEAMRILQAMQREKLQAAQLGAIIDNIDEAVIAVTPEHKVSFFNRHARRICSISPGAPPDFDSALAVFAAGEKEKITTINGNSVIARSIPLEFDHCVRGKVVTLHEVTRIQASESKIRTSFHQKGAFMRAISSRI